MRPTYFLLAVISLPALMTTFHLTSAECCGNPFSGCNGIGGCNMFCCNCDNGCAPSPTPDCKACRWDHLSTLSVFYTYAKWASCGGYPPARLMMHGLLHDMFVVDAHAMSLMHAIVIRAPDYYYIHIFSMLFLWQRYIYFVSSRNIRHIHQIWNLVDS